MEILILLTYIALFLIGDLMGKRGNKNNISLEEIKNNIVCTTVILSSIFIILAIGINLNNINNSTMAFLILGLGLGFEKGQGNFADFSWLLKSNNK